MKTPLAGLATCLAVVLGLVNGFALTSTSSPQELSREAATERSLALGDTLLKQGDLDGAITEYFKALGLAPEDFRVHRALGDVFYKKRELDDAIDEYRRALRLKPEDAAAHSGLGEALFAKEDVVGAAAEFREALRLDPNYSPAHRGYASAFRMSGDIAGAVAEFREAVRLDPSDPMAQQGLGDSLILTLDYSGAAMALRESIRLDPNKPFTHRRLGDALYRLQQLDAAIVSLREALRLNPNDYSTHGAFGSALLAKRDFDGAIAEFREVLRLSPNNPMVRRLAIGSLTTAFTESKRFSEAFAELQPALERDPNDPGLLFTLGVARVRSGQADEGLAAFEKGLRLAPSPGALNNVAYELAQNNAHLDVAMRYAEQAVGQQAARTAQIFLPGLSVADLRAMPVLSAYWDTLGWVYFRRGQVVEAQKYIGAAWRLSQWGPMGNHLGQLYEKAGDTQQAIHYYARALAGPRADTESEQVRSRLAALLGNETGIEDAVAKAREELGQMRTVRLPRLTNGPAKAEFFVMFTPDAGTTAVRFISGSEELRDATNAIVSANYDVTFPDPRPAKIVRRGILDCPTTGANCQFVLLPSESATSVN